MHGGFCSSQLPGHQDGVLKHVRTSYSERPMYRFDASGHPVDALQGPRSSFVAWGLCSKVNFGFLRAMGYLVGLEFPFSAPYSDLKPSPYISFQRKQNDIGSRYLVPTRRSYMCLLKFDESRERVLVSALAFDRFARLVWFQFFHSRRSHSVLRNSLPQKEEYVLLVRMTSFQRTLYDTFMNEVVRTKAVPNPLKAFAVCCKVNFKFIPPKIVSFRHLAP